MHLNQSTNMFFSKNLENTQVFIFTDILLSLAEA